MTKHLEGNKIEPKMTTREEKKEEFVDICDELYHRREDNYDVYHKLAQKIHDFCKEKYIAEGKRIAVERYIHHNDTYANDWYIDWEKEMLGDLSTKKWEDGEM